MTRTQFARLLRELAESPELLRALADELEHGDAPPPAKSGPRRRPKKIAIENMTPEQIARADARLARAGISRER